MTSKRPLPPSDWPTSDQFPTNSPTYPSDSSTHSIASLAAGCREMPATRSLKGDAAVVGGVEAFFAPGSTDAKCRYLGVVD